MKRVIFVLIFFFLATFLYGQNVPKTLFWKITKAGSNNESFLFGTFHEVSPSFFDSLTNVVTKLKNSDILLVEERISGSKTATLTNQRQWTSKKWNTILTNEQKQIFSQFVKKAEDTSYYNLNPLLLSLTTSRLYLSNFCQLDKASTELMDHHIEKIALKSIKQIYSLDNNQEILLKNAAEKLTSLEDSLYTTSSVRSMKNMLNDDSSDCQILNDYKNFDINYDFDLDLSKNPNHSTLLIQRNTRWAIMLNKLLSTNNCFIAVGFRHLMYKQGLIQLLRNLGYSVTSVPIDF